MYSLHFKFKKLLVCLQTHAGVLFFHCATIIVQNSTPRLCRKLSEKTQINPAKPSKAPNLPSSLAEDLSVLYLQRHRESFWSQQQQRAGQNTATLRDMKLSQEIMRLLQLSQISQAPPCTQNCPGQGTSTTYIRSREYMYLEDNEMAKTKLLCSLSYKSVT